MKRKCYFFANDNDYNMFTSFLKEVTTILIDTKPLLINESINPLKNILEAESIQVCLLNTNIVSLPQYSEEYNNIQGYAHFHPIGKGRSQLLRSTVEKGKFLKNGHILEYYYILQNIVVKKQYLYLTNKSVWFEPLKYFSKV